MNIVDCLQGEAAWFECRLGCVTSSRVADVIAKRKRVKEGQIPEEMACRRNMRFELLGELLTGSATENYVSRWMQEGKDKEPLARAEYEILMDLDVTTVGYVYHPTIKFAGASPDGLIYQSGQPIGAVEFKCPKLETHLGYLAAGEIPDEYLPQLLWQLACGPELQWIDFVSYHDKMREPYRIFRRRLERTEQVNSTIAAMEAEAEVFLSEVKAMAEQLKQSAEAAVLV